MIKDILGVGYPVENQPTKSYTFISDFNSEDKTRVVYNRTYFFSYYSMDSNECWN